MVTNGFMSSYYDNQDGKKPLVTDKLHAIKYI